MTFKQASVANRIAVRDGSVKLGNLAQRLTIGSGPVDSDLSTEIDALAITMQTALVDAGYDPVLPSNSAIVVDGQTIAVTGGTVTLTVADGVLSATYTASQGES